VLGGELAAARSVGFPASRFCSTQREDIGGLKAALGYQVGRIVLDSTDEIDQLGALTRPASRC